VSGIRRIRILFTIPYSGTEHATYTYREYSVAYSMTQPDAFHLHGNFRHLRKFNAKSLVRSLERTAREISRFPPNPPLDDMGPVSIPLSPVAPMGEGWGGCE
jgi:hypothetical protein